MYSDHFTLNANRQLSLSLRSIIVGAAVARKALSERLLLNTLAAAQNKTTQRVSARPRNFWSQCCDAGKTNIAALISRQFMLLIRLKNVGFELSYVSRASKRTFQHKRAGVLNACPCFTFYFCIALSASLALCISGTCSHLFTLSFYSLFTSCFGSWQADFHTYACKTSRAKTNLENHSGFDVLQHFYIKAQYEILIFHWWIDNRCGIGVTGCPEVEAVDWLLW